MAYRLKHRPEIVWLTSPLTIVTEWKRGFNGQPIPKTVKTGHPGMALVVMNLPNGRQQFNFATREEVEAHFEEDAVPEHVQSETTYAYAWPPVAWGNLDKSLLPRDGFYVEPPEAPKAL